MNTLMKAQQEALLSYHGSSAPGETINLDHSDPAHQEIINTMLAAAGRTADTYPHLFGSMNGDASTAAAKGKNSADTDLDKVHLVDAGMTASGKATATVWSRSSGDTMVNIGSLMIFDADSGELLAQSDNSSVRNGFLACQAHSEPVSADKNLSLLYVGHVIDGDGSARSFSYSNNMQAAAPGGGDVQAYAESGIQATVTQPVFINPKPPPIPPEDIMIAVGRTTANPPPSYSDYIYLEPTGGTETNPYLIVPFVGSAPLSGTIDLSALTIADLTTSVFVNNGNGGTAEVTRATQYTTDAKMVAAFSVGSPPNILQWSFPYGSGGGYQTTTSIVYNSTSMGNEVESFFYFAFNGIPLQGGGVAPPFFVCSKSTPGEPSINCTQIPNLYFWWHCVAEGTLVTLEDGSQKPIEEINETYRVKAGTEGKGLAVSATVLGRHASDGKDNQIFRLTTANGKTITATQCHTVFMAPDKCRMIAHMAEGDPIVTDEGASTVASNEPVAGDTMFYGLALGNLDEMTRDDFPKNMAGYYGNGILCGDQFTMRASVKAAHSDLDYMLPRINKEIHQDYASALQQKRY